MTKDGAEVDLIVERLGKKYLFIEIKSSKNVSEFNLNTLAKLIEDFNAASSLGSEALCFSNDDCKRKLANGVMVYPSNQFERDVKKILTSKNLKDLSTYLQVFPEAGDIILGTSGVRKLRWINPKNNKGKSGGLRILYHYSNDILILLLSAYSKSETDNITEADKNELRKYVPVIIEQVMEDLK
ncbi:MAG: hypothetical protein KGO93_01800 [Cyanobacteria bacterium REEB446]|nr:hypothetical protein [Cyanobacteria bacterium REEB446]